jgi:hypothetical protein
VNCKNLDSETTMQRLCYHLIVSAYRKGQAMSRNTSSSSLDVKNPKALKRFIKNGERKGALKDFTLVLIAVGAEK